MIRILIVAAYASVRAGLHVLLAEAEDITIVGEASGSAELERLLPEARPDVVLADDNAADSARLLDALADREIGLVVLGDSRTDYRRLADGPLPGWAYLRKEADGAEMIGAARAVAAGLIVLDRSLAPLLAEPPLIQIGQETEEVLPGEALTAREREVLQRMAQGLPNKVIAARLNISLHTVKFHVASILAKLGATSRTEAVTLGARRGYILL
ncbi:MAG TPA: response regulator transcription factor [Chthonomonadaceae bacterium]|nr:response regulator transcription factor [Chthonomonadaceae bacterium]